MFNDSLEMKLSLTVNRLVLKIPGGNIKSLDLDLQPYGFTCSLSFWVSNETDSDKLFPLFIMQELMEARLTIEPRFEPHDKKLMPIVVQGLVTSKDILTEQSVEEIHLKGRPVLYRHYRIEFADPARVLWRQHFPCELMTDKSVRDLIDAHKGPHIDLKYDWDVLDEKFAINALALGDAENTASFYDFVVWYVASNNGVFSYDGSKNVYTFSADKPGGLKPTPMDWQDVEDLRIDFPGTCRNEVAVLNSYSEKAKRKVVEQEQSVDGIRHDYLVRHEIPADFENRIRLEQERLKIREHEIQVTFGQYPKVPCCPGCLCGFKGELWSKKMYPYGKSYRIRSISLIAGAADTEITADHNMPYAVYDIDMACRLELKKETWICLPDYNQPQFPLYVEGKVVSEQGEKEAETYQVYKDEDTSQDMVRVAIPLFDNQQVVVLFEPYFFPGHFYFPEYKYARVLVALEFHSGRIERFLDWRSGARLPLDTQGNHILFGKTDTSQTSVRHTYVDEKPVFNMIRTSEKDTEMIKLVEGNLILETKEDE